MPNGFGPLSKDELMAIWRGAVDDGYAQPLVDAGDGGGLEVHSQNAAQLALVSQAVDSSTQALYLLPHSAQTDEPATGGALATVQLTFARTGLLYLPLVLGAGMVFYEEEQTDWGRDGGEQVATGRRYTLTQDLVFMPGDAGPHTATAQAEKIGTGYNLPQPGTIKLVDQPGKAYSNVLATVAVRAGAAPPPQPPPNLQVTLTCTNEPDMLTPDSVGQYVLFTGGANVGSAYRVVGFAPPNPSANQGSTGVLEDLWVVSNDVFSGTFIPGELAFVANTAPAGAKLAWVRVVGAMTMPGTSPPLRKVAFVLLSGSWTPGANGPILTGQLSGATVVLAQGALGHATYDLAPSPQVEAPVGGAGGASWRVLDWVIDWGLSVTNAAQPSGGRHATLDQAGADRLVFRGPGEPDSVYRDRVARVADVVSPNAILRSLYKRLGAIPFCFREVGSPALPGMYYDGDNAPPSATPGRALDDCYDVDTVSWIGFNGFGFIDHEPVEYRNAAGDKLLFGWFGRISGGIGPRTLLVIRRQTTQGLLPATPNVGDVVVGLRSGTHYQPSLMNDNPTFAPRRFRVYLDYEQMRAFFLVGLPRYQGHDQGFAYDVGAFGAYDAAPYDDFYDGASIGGAQGESAFYKGVWNEVNRVKAGGVGFDIYRLSDGETCP